MNWNKPIQEVDRDLYEECCSILSLSGPSKCMTLESLAAALDSRDRLLVEEDGISIKTSKIIKHGWKSLQDYLKSHAYAFELSGSTVCLRTSSPLPWLKRQASTSMSPPPGEEVWKEGWMGIGTATPTPSKSSVSPSIGATNDYQSSQAKEDTPMEDVKAASPGFLPPVVKSPRATSSSGIPEPHAGHALQPSERQTEGEAEDSGEEEEEDFDEDVQFVPGFNVPPSPLTPEIHLNNLLHNSPSFLFRWVCVNCTATNEPSLPHAFREWGLAALQLWRKYKTNQAVREQHYRANVKAVRQQVLEWAARQGVSISLSSLMPSDADAARDNPLPENCPFTWPKPPIHPPPEFPPLPEGDPFSDQKCFECTAPYSTTEQGTLAWFTLPMRMPSQSAPPEFCVTTGSTPAKRSAHQSQGAPLEEIEFTEDEVSHVFSPPGPEVYSKQAVSYNGGIALDGVHGGLSTYYSNPSYPLDAHGVGVALRTTPSRRGREAPPPASTTEGLASSPGKLKPSTATPSPSRRGVNESLIFPVHEELPSEIHAAGKAVRQLCFEVLGHDPQELAAAWMELGPTPPNHKPLGTLPKRSPRHARGSARKDAQGTSREAASRDRGQSADFTKQASSHQEPHARPRSASIGSEGASADVADPSALQLLPPTLRRRRSDPMPAGEKAQGRESASLPLLPAELERFGISVFGSTMHRVGIGYDHRMLSHRELKRKKRRLLPIPGLPYVENAPHPERPTRLAAMVTHLVARGLFQRCWRVPSRMASDKELLTVHNKDHLAAVEAVAQGDFTSFGSDTYASRESAMASKLSCGTVLEVTHRVITGETQAGVALVRPPGHHAECNRCMGFCLFNNVAVAAGVARKYWGVRRVLIVDWDVHHGNGTQHMFEGDPSVLYFSIHRHDNGDFYPGTGAADEVGVDAGAGYSVNVPWSAPGMGDAEYLAAFEEVLMPIARQFCPELVLISAGFDAAAGDPLGECCITPTGYAHMTAMLKTLAGGRVVVALEGGYNLRSISRSMEAVVRVLLGESPPAFLRPLFSPGDGSDGASDPFGLHRRRGKSFAGTPYTTRHGRIMHCAPALPPPSITAMRNISEAIAIQSQYWDCLRVKVTALQSTLNIGGAVHHALHPGTLPGLMRPNRASFGMSQGTEEGTDDGEDSEDSGELLPDAEDESESSDAAPHSQVETHDRLRQDRSGFEEELGPEELAHEASRDLEIEDEESSSHETGGVEIKGAASDVAITPRIDGNGGLPVSQEERPMGPHVTAVPEPQAPCISPNSPKLLSALPTVHGDDFVPIGPLPHSPIPSATPRSQQLHSPLSGLGAESGPSHSAAEDVWASVVHPAQVKPGEGLHHDSRPSQSPPAAKTDVDGLHPGERGEATPKRQRVDPESRKMG